MAPRTPGRQAAHMEVVYERFGGTQAVTRLPLNESSHTGPPTSMASAALGHARRNTRCDRQLDCKGASRGPPASPRLQDRLVTCPLGACAARGVSG
jgi:hypothetical protein